MSFMGLLQRFLQRIVPKPIQQLAEFIRFAFLTVVNTVLLLFLYVFGMSLTFALAKLLHIDLGFNAGEGKSQWHAFEKMAPERRHRPF